MWVLYFCFEQHFHFYILCLILSLSQWHSFSYCVSYTFTFTFTYLLTLAFTFIFSFTFILIFSFTFNLNLNLNFTFTFWITLNFISCVEYFHFHFSFHFIFSFIFNLCLNFKFRNIILKTKCLSSSLWFQQYCWCWIVGLLRPKQTMIFQNTTEVFLYLHHFLYFALNSIYYNFLDKNSLCICDLFVKVAYATLSINK